MFCLLFLDACSDRVVDVAMSLKHVRRPDRLLTWPRLCYVNTYKPVPEDPV
jgi:hypothetical protein